MQDLLSDAFRALSARLGQDPLRVQGPGGNTSIKGIHADGKEVMWIKASGTELADAMSKPIFVAVDRLAAQAEAHGEGDGSCKATVLDPENRLRPSIETTFHAALDWSVVAHTHSIATLVHAVSPEGRLAADAVLDGLPFVRVPYAKPGLPLTRQILARVKADTQVVILENHGLICCANSVGETARLIDEVETRLFRTARDVESDQPEQAAPQGYVWSQDGWIARDPRSSELVLSGSFYPDHVVFLGPALPRADATGSRPAVVIEGTGIAIKADATASQRAMLRCLSDLLRRLPADWTAEPIGTAAEAELLNWDAEKYRQALAARE